MTISEKSLPTEKQKKAVAFINNTLGFNFKATSKEQCHQIIAEHLDKAKKIASFGYNGCMIYKNSQLTGCVLLRSCENSYYLVISKQNYDYENACSLACKAFDCPNEQLTVNNGYFSMENHELFLHSDNEDGLYCPVWIIERAYFDGMRVYDRYTPEMLEILKRMKKSKI